MSAVDWTDTGINHIAFQRWLERTPGLEGSETSFDFWAKYKRAVQQYLHQYFYVPAKVSIKPTVMYYLQQYLYIIIHPLRAFVNT